MIRCEKRRKPRIRQQAGSHPNQLPQEVGHPSNPWEQFTTA